MTVAELVEELLGELQDPILAAGLLAVALLFAAGHLLPIVLDIVEAVRRRRRLP